MSEDEDLARIAVEHGGWLATIAAGIGVWILKTLISNQFTLLLEEHRRLQSDVTVLMAKVSRIEGALGINGITNYVGGK